MPGEKEKREKILEALAEDEVEAIEAYEKAMKEIESDREKEQLEKILIEEKAHLAYLKEAMRSEGAVYEEPLLPEEAEAIEPDWME